MERIDEIGFGGLKIIQEQDDFCYGIDAVLLADMASKDHSGSVMIADLGTGNGIVPLILSHKIPGSLITGFEMEAKRAGLAARSISSNGLEDRINIINCDITDISRDADGTFDLITMNPPYIRRGSGIKNAETLKMTARHETTAGIDEFMKTAARLLKDRGEAFLVHRPSRLADIFSAARSVRMEPKQMRLVVPRRGDGANICLIRFAKNGGPQLEILPELAVRNADGSYTDEIQSIYERI